MTQSIDPKRIPDSAWELIEITPEYRRYRCVIDDNGSYALKTEFIGEERLIADNQELLNDSYGKRFGDGRVVARIPLNVLYSEQSEIAKKMREGDEDHLRWWLNHEQARPFRTFRGHI
jgi:hypothetical protein